MLRVCAAHLQHLRCVSQRAAALAQPAPAARCCLSAQILYSLLRHCSTTAWPALHVSSGQGVPARQPTRPPSDVQACIHCTITAHLLPEQPRAQEAQVRQLHPDRGGVQNSHHIGCATLGV